MPEPTTPEPTRARLPEGAPTPEDLLAEVAKERGIPADLLLAACEAAYGTPLDYLDDFRSMAFALAAVLPPHRAQIEREVRAEVAEELRRDAVAHRSSAARRAGDRRETLYDRANVLDSAAARITRGEA